MQGILRPAAGRWICTALALFGCLATARTADAQCAPVPDNNANIVTCATGSDMDIDLQDGDDQLFLSGTTVTGFLRGGAGNDTVVVTSSDISGLTEMTGGGGDNTLTFDGFTGMLGAAITEWQTIEFTNGTVAIWRPDPIFQPFLTTGDSTALFDVQAGSEIFVPADGVALNDATYVAIDEGRFNLDGKIRLANGEIGDLFTVQSQSGLGTATGNGIVLVDVVVDDLINGPNMGTGGSDVFWLAVVTPQPGMHIGLLPNILGIGPKGFTDELIPLAIVSDSPVVTDPDLFYLVGGDVTAGNYVYDLVYVPDTVFNQNVFDQWFLHNIGLSPDLATYAVNLTVAQRTWDANVRTMRERMGYLHGETPKADLFAAREGMQYASLNDAAADSDPLQVSRLDGDGPGRELGVSLWVNGTFDSTHDDSNGAGDVGYDGRTDGVVAGADVALGSLFGGDDRLFLGLFAGYGSTRADYSESLGDLTLDGTILGAYATLTTGGFYLDAVVAWQSLDFESHNAVTTGDARYDGHAVGGSLEAGYRLDLGGVDLEPQVQLTYVNVSHEDFVDSIGAVVAADQGASLQLRGGIRASTTVEIGDGVQLRPYVDLSVIHEFFDGNRVVVLGGTFEDALYDTAFEVGGGAALGLPNGMQVFLDVDYRAASDYSSVNGVVGLRLSF